MADSSFQRFCAVTLGLVTTCLANGAGAQTFTFDSAAYVTCREAHAMTPEARRAVATLLVDHSARRHKVVVPDDERGAQLAYLVRSGCTVSPDAYLFAVIDRAVTSESSKLPQR